MIKTSSPVRATMLRMSKVAIATVLLVGSGLSFATVDAATRPAPTCHVASRSTHVETRVGPNQTLRHRTVTETISRCDGRITTLTTFSAWR